MANGGVGVLLINLGTPDAPEPAAVRRYLAEFLSDRRVVDLPPLLWQPILRGAILPFRPRKSAEAYRLIWMKEGSPLAVITRRQAEALQALLGPEATVDYAMRYGSPAIPAALDRLVEAGCDRILAVPLYPQFSGATTGTVEDALAGALAGSKRKPALKTLPPYYAEPLYIDALAANLQRQLQALDFEPQRLLLSFHGLPQRMIDRGDPYFDHCTATARLLAHRLPLPVDVAFQSRFGRAKWLEPATDATLAAYPAKGITRIAIAAPGFAADCIETLEELGIRGRETFLAAGGEHFARLDCLNDSPEGMHMLEGLARRELAASATAE
jgi:protoporphyrin/coproporphyrin ferrochelatase